MEPVVLIQLLLGSGSFVLLLRISFVAGQQQNRLDQLEKSVAIMGDRYEELSRDFHTFQRSQGR